MKDITLGYAFCGSFCTIKKSLEALKELAKNDIKIVPIMSQIVYTTDTRFGSAAELKDAVEEICGAKIIHDIAAAEPIGPKNLLDIMEIINSPILMLENKTKDGCFFVVITNTKFIYVYGVKVSEIKKKLNNKDN